MRRIKYFKTVRAYIDNQDWLHDYSLSGKEGYDLWLRSIIKENSDTTIKYYNLLLSGHVQDEKYVILNDAVKKFNKKYNYYPQFKYLNFEN